MLFMFGTQAEIGSVLQGAPCGIDAGVPGDARVNEGGAAEDELPVLREHL